MWEKVVLNLLSNALKATGQGGIRLALDDDGDCRARLTVGDTGVGIPSEQLPELFQRFHRVTGPTGRRAEGTGLGLALIRELVRLHDGEIDVTRRCRGGRDVHRPAAVRQRVHPTRDRRNPAPPAGATAPAGAQGTRPNWTRPLPRNRSAAGRAPGALRRRQRRPARLRGRTAGRAVPGGDRAGRPAALAAITRDPPDLVIADVMMPVWTASPCWPPCGPGHRPPAGGAALRPRRAGGRRGGARRRRADDYLVKPSPVELLARVRANLDRASVRLRRGSWANQLLQSMDDGIFVSRRRRESSRRSTTGGRS
jgi:CheY-like chemotaxis protein